MSACRSASRHCCTYAMYDNLCRSTGQRHDPCLLDTFVAAVDYANGAPPRPWWEYSRERKARAHA